MDKLIEVLLQMVGYIPPELMVVGIISYLIWFNNIHKKEHRIILQRLAESEKRDTASVEDLKNLYKLVLRASIVNADIPKSARLEMYDEYKLQGFNSWVDEYVEKHLYPIDDK